MWRAAGESLLAGREDLVGLAHQHRLGDLEFQQVRRQSRLAQRARSQAIRFGTRFFAGWSVEALTPGVDGAPPDPG